MSKCRWSFTEIILTSIVLVLGAVCIGLIVISLQAVAIEQPTNSTLRGSLIITEGAVYTEELKNKSSLTFKALAFDTERLISDAFERSFFKDRFEKCRVIDFSYGSVLVYFDLFFNYAVDSKSAQDELIKSVQSSGGLVIDTSSIDITAFTCPDGQRACKNKNTCVDKTLFCDGVPDCPDGSDESSSSCKTVCDGQFLLPGPNGSFHSKNFPLDYEYSSCRWIIRVNNGLVIKIVFEAFQTEDKNDVLYLYEGTGPDKKLAYALSGSYSPGTVRLFSSEATVEFTSDSINNQQGFNVSYWAEDISQLTIEEKINCTFEEGFCFWTQEPTKDDGDWIRASGPTFPPLTGPNFDHTLNSGSGYYIVTQRSPGDRDEYFKIYSLPFTSEEKMCLRLWCYMFGEDVYVLRIRTNQLSAVIKGNFGEWWKYTQYTLNSINGGIVIEAQKSGGFLNDIALDDISITSGPCGDEPPPTPPPPPTTDCGGPFDLYEPNTIFSSPNYPNGYANSASCLWTLHAKEGQNIQLHFQDFALLSPNDVVEVRDGVDPQSTLLGVLTGDGSFPDLFSTSSEMTVWFYSDPSGNSRGFRANFSTGFGLGQPEPCQTEQYQCRSGECVSSSSVCDGVVNCPDGSDEAFCVHLMSTNFTEANLLKLQIKNSLYTACALDWSSQFSNFFCQYLGYRSGSALYLPQSADDAPFAIVSLGTNGSLDLKPSETCPGEKVVSLQCDNQPCGNRKINFSSSSLEEDLWMKTDGEKSESPSGRVVGGEDAQKGAWPWMAVMTQWGTCGAALIDSEWLVTAAHCVYGKNIHLYNWVVGVGLYLRIGNNVSEVQFHHVDQVIINPHYNRRTKDSNIALVHLKTRVTFTDYIQPICLPRPEQHFEPGRKCVIAGWGLVKPQEIKNELQQATLPLLNNTQCQEWLPEYNITERMVCAGYADGGVGSCRGDEGGPLMCEDGGNWILAGVTSSEVGCGQPKKPGVYTLVSHFTDWIIETRRFKSHWNGSRQKQEF